MSLHPEVVAKAQAELEAVVGPNRLPDHADRSDLPYVNAIIKECLRWQNAVPLGIPHAAVEDDEFDGYFIPAGTVVFPNAWQVPVSSRFLSEGSFLMTHCPYSGPSSTTSRRTQSQRDSSPNGS